MGRKSLVSTVSDDVESFQPLTGIEPTLVGVAVDLAAMLDALVDGVADLDGGEVPERVKEYTATSRELRAILAALLKSPTRGGDDGDVDGGLADPA